MIAQLLTVLSVAEAGGRTGLYNPCANKSAVYHTQPWCDVTVPLPERVADMIGRLTAKEKVQGMMIQNSFPSLGIPAYNWWEESTHGVSPFGAPKGDGTNFAFPLTTGAAFNRTLWRATGRQIGREARAYMNVGQMGSTFWAPVVNLARDGRWGRNIESPGEECVRALPACFSCSCSC